MKLYVSTYAKYNRGSLAGAWLNLDDYRNADEFAAACRRLHRDERDPEIMFQDCETDPGADWQEGLYSESSIPREYWTLKAEAEAEAKRIATTPEKGARAKERAEQSALSDRFLAATGWKGKMADFFRKDFFFLTLANGEIYHIQKPKIETRFCEGEDGEDERREACKRLAAKETESGFKRANLERIDEILRYWTSDKWRSDGTFLRPSYDEGADALSDDRPGPYYRFRMDEWKLPLGARFVTDEDARRIADGFRKVRADFEKRLNAYWKRFGASKIRTWTYWTQA